MLLRTVHPSDGDVLVGSQESSVIETESPFTEIYFIQGPSPDELAAGPASGQLDPGSPRGG